MAISNHLIKHFGFKVSSWNQNELILYQAIHRQWTCNVFATYYYCAMQC